MINGQIRDKEVRVIGQDGEQIGIMSPREAMKLAQEAELDLVKIARRHSRRYARSSITASTNTNLPEKKRKPGKTEDG